MISISGNSSAEIYATKLRSLIPDGTLRETFNVFFFSQLKPRVFFFFYIDVLEGLPCSTLFKWTPERWMFFKQNGK